jgi:cytochrome P450
VRPAGVVYPSPETCRAPYPLFARLREEAPVQKVPGRSEYLVSRHEDIVAVMRQPEVFSNLVFVIEDGAVRNATLEDARPGRVGPIFSADPPSHTHKRKLAFEFFKPGRLPAYKPAIAAAVDDLIDGFASTGRCEFVSEFATPLPTRAIFGILGLPEEDAAKALRWGDYDGHGNRYQPPARRANLENGIRDMVAYIREAVLERHERPRDDMLSEFIRAHVEADGRFDVGNIVAEAVNFINGGMHTTRDMLGNTLRFLLERVEDLESVRHDSTLLVKAIEESLRLEPTLQWTGRLALCDAEVAGTPIPAGSVLILLLASANHDAAIFDDPGTFDPRRADLKSHLAFGTHIHSCLGAPLARLEGTIAFEHLFRRLRNVRLAGQNDFEPRESLNFRGLKALHLEFDPE